MANRFKTPEVLKARVTAIFQTLTKKLCNDDRKNEKFEYLSFNNSLKDFQMSTKYLFVNDGTHLSVFWESFIAELLEVFNKVRSAHRLPNLIGWLGYAISKNFTHSKTPTAEVLRKILFPNASRMHPLEVYFTTAVFSFICDDKELCKLFFSKSDAFVQDNLADHLAYLIIESYENDENQELMVYVKYAFVRCLELYPSESSMEDGPSEFVKGIDWTGLKAPELPVLNELSESRNNLENIPNNKKQKTENKKVSECMSYLSYQLTRVIVEKSDISLPDEENMVKYFKGANFKSNTTLFGNACKWTDYLLEIPYEKDPKLRRIYYIEVRVLTIGSIKVGICKSNETCTSIKGPIIAYCEPFENSTVSVGANSETKYDYKEGSIIGIMINTGKHVTNEVVTFYVDKKEESKKITKGQGNVPWARPTETHKVCLFIQLPMLQAAVPSIFTNVWSNIPTVPPEVKLYPLVVNYREPCMVSSSDFNNHPNASTNA